MTQRGQAPTIEATTCRRRTRGAAALEAALLTPLFLALVFGIIEAGTYSYSYLTVQDVAADGARTGTIARDGLDADARILSTIRDNSGILKRASIERIVIYEASAADADPPAACTSGPVVSIAAAKCSVYGPEDLDSLPPPGDCGWCGLDRDQGELLGLWIRFDYESLTGMFDSLTFTQRKVLPIEPDL